MAITFTAGTPSESTGSVTSLTPALPAGLTTGDYTIMVCALNATAGTITPPGGATWTAILPSTGATQNTADVHAIYYRKWQAGDANPTFTCTSGRFAILPIKVSGADTTTFVNTAVAVTHTGAATTTVIAPTITPSSVQLCCTFNGRHASNGIFVNFSTPAGMTEVGECVGKSTTQTNAGASFCQQTVTAGVATGTRTSTASVAVTGGMGTSFALNVASTGPVTATLAGTTPTTTGALTATQGQTASLASTTPAVTGALTATQRQVASVTATTPAVTSAVTATVATFMVASLTGTTPAVTGSVTAQQRQAVALAGTTAVSTGALTATQGQVVSLTATAPATTGTITAQQRQVASLTGTVPTTTAALTTLQQATLTVVAVAHSTDTTATSTRALTVPADPVGRTVVVVSALSSNARTVSTMSGLGAVWEKVVVEGAMDREISVWLGSGASTSGDITATLASGTAFSTLAAWVLAESGVTAQAAAVSNPAGGATTFSGPSMSTAAGNLVIGAATTATSTLTFPSARTPTSGWTDRDGLHSTVQSAFSHRSAGGEAHQLSATLNVNTRTATVAQVVLSAVSVGGAVTGTLAATTPAVTGSVVATQQQAATLAGVTAAVTGTLTAAQQQAGTLAGATPAVIGSLTASQQQVATLATTTPAVTAVITTAGGVLPTTATLTAVTPTVTGVLTATQQQQATLVGTTAATLGSLVAVQWQQVTLAGVTPGVTGTMAAAQHEPATLGGITPAVTTDLTVTFTLRPSLTGVTPAVTGLFVAAGLGKPAIDPRVTTTYRTGTASASSRRGGAQVPPYAGTVRVAALTGSVQMEEA